MQVIVGKNAGFCFGVKRAINLAFESADRRGVVRTLGPIIHNPQVVDRLNDRGVGVVDELHQVDSPEQTTLIIRSHGTGPDTYQQAENLGMQVEDATCPFVRKIHRLVTDLLSQGYEILILGEPNHPEVEAIRAYAGPQAHVVEQAEEVRDLPLGRRIGIVAQTTQSQQRLQEIVSAVLARGNNEVRTYNTICDATDVRQTEAVELARSADVVIVVGGRKSANTSRLAEICARIQPRTHHIETLDDLDPAWLQGARQVAVTAGASTPDDLINEIVEYIGALEASEQGS